MNALKTLGIIAAFGIMISSCTPVKHCEAYTSNDKPKTQITPAEKAVELAFENGQIYS